MSVSTGEELVVVDEDSMLFVNDFVADFVLVFLFDCGCCLAVSVVLLVFRLFDFEFVCPAATGCTVAPAGCTVAGSSEMVVM